MLTKPDQTEQQLRGRVGPVLSDGKRLNDLIDFDEREVSMRVLRDPDIYRLEMQNLFARSWIGLGHESEIPKPGDFMLRYHGETQVIVSRAADGTVHVMLNVCAHRGMEVCWADYGNQPSFKCPYHGWTFDGTGKLIGSPFEKEVYPGWDKSKYPLRSARVALHQGLIFANFDADAPSFQDYAGGILWYIDHVLGGVEWEPTGPAHRLTIPVNWKVLMDQLAGDTYHAATLHRSLVEMGVQPPEPTFLDHVKVTLPPTGHSVFTFNPPSPREGDPYAFDGRPMVTVVFPTTGVGGGGEGMEQMRPGGVQSANIILHAPRGPDAFEQWQLNLVPKGTSDEIKRLVARTNSTANGFILVDDSQQGPSMQRAASTYLGSEQPMRYFSQGGTYHPNNWPGPGIAHAGVSRDETSWEFWKHWYDVMTVTGR